MSRVLSLAGFRVTLIGRFWVIPEAVPKESAQHLLEFSGVLGIINPFFYFPSALGDANRTTGMRLYGFALSRGRMFRKDYASWQRAVGRTGERTAAKSFC